MKALIFLRWRAGLARPESKARWLNHRRQRAEKRPGHSYRSIHTLPPDALRDALVGQGFETPEAMSLCHGTDAGRVVTSDSTTHPSYRLRMAVESQRFEIAAGRK